MTLDFSAPPPEGGSRRRALIVLGALAASAVLLLGLITLIGGGSSSDTTTVAATDPPVASVPSSARPTGPPTTGPPTTGPPTTGPKPTTAAKTTAAPAAPPRSTPAPAAVTCTKAPCALAGDPGHVLAALNAYRVAHGRPAVTGAATAPAGLCALKSGDTASCPNSYFWEPVTTPTGTEVVTKIAAQGKGASWLSDPLLTSVQIGWAQNAQHGYSCALIAAARPSH